MPDCLFVCPLFVTGDSALLQYHLEYHGLPRVAQYLIESDSICESLDTHHCDHRLDELFPLVLVRQILSQYRYRVCFVLSFTGGALVVFQVFRLGLVVQGVHAMATRSALGSVSCGIGLVALPTSISLIVCYRVPLGIYLGSDFLLTGSAGYVNWLAVV